MKVYITFKRIMVFTLALILSLSWSASCCEAAGSTAAGFYIYMNPVNSHTLPEYATALSKSYIDGGTVLLQWSQIQPNAPTHGVEQYDWTNLDLAINEIVAQHKKLVVGLIAGNWCPAWLYQTPYSVPHQTFNYSPSSDTVPCIPITQPVVWNPVFRARYIRAIRALSAHIQANPAAWSALTCVKLSGVNLTTEEFRMVSFSNGVPSTTSTGTLVPSTSLEIADYWKEMGCTPTNIVDTTLSIAKYTLEAFPGKLLAFAIIHRGSFPPINNRGDINTTLVQTPLNDQPHPDPVTVGTLDALLNFYKGHLIVQWDSLNNTPILPDEVLQAGAKGAIIGWQMNGYVHGYGYTGGTGSGCIYPNVPVGCLCKNNTDFQQILEVGIKSGGQYFEVQTGSVVTGAYDAPFAQARADLDKALANSN